MPYSSGIPFVRDQIDVGSRYDNAAAAEGIGDDRVD